jgi:hypothetical protein
MWNNFGKEFFEKDGPFGKAALLHLTDRSRSEGLRRRRRSVWAGVEGGQ